VRQAIDRRREKALNLKEAKEGLHHAAAFYARYGSIHGCIGHHFIDQQHSGDMSDGPRIMEQ